MSPEISSVSFFWLLLIVTVLQIIYYFIISNISVDMKVFSFTLIICLDHLLAISGFFTSGIASAEAPLASGKAKVGAAAEQLPAKSESKRT